MYHIYRAPLFSTSVEAFVKVISSSANVSTTVAGNLVVESVSTVSETSKE